MSIISSILIAIAWITMLGGVIYYITVGSKGNLDVLRAFFFILSFLTVGAVLMVLAMLLA